MLKLRDVRPLDLFRFKQEMVKEFSNMPEVPVSGTWVALYSSREDVFSGVGNESYNLGPQIIIHLLGNDGQPTNRTIKISGPSAHTIWQFDLLEYAGQSKLVTE